VDDVSSEDAEIEGLDDDEEESEQEWGDLDLDAEDAHN
jgi:hypothetical protein